MPFIDQIVRALRGARLAEVPTGALERIAPKAVDPLAGVRQAELMAQVKLASEYPQLAPADRKELMQRLISAGLGRAPSETTRAANEAGDLRSLMMSEAIDASVRRSRFSDYDLLGGSAGGYHTAMEKPYHKLDSAVDRLWKRNEALRKRETRLRGEAGAMRPLARAYYEQLPFNVTANHPPVHLIDIFNSLMGR